MSQSLEEYAAYYLPRLQAANNDDAIHALMEAEDGIVPILINAYTASPSAPVRHRLIEIIASYRTAPALSFLAATPLHSTQTDVWQAALDGTVTAEQSFGYALLERMQQQFLAAQPQDTTRILWIEDALEHLRTMLAENQTL